MDPDERELPVPEELERIDGNERERLVEQVIARTDLRKVDQYIRNEGYGRRHAIAHRERYPDYEFDLYTVTLQYQDQENLASAIWNGIPPARMEATEITYEEISDEIGLEEALENTSLDERNVLPLVVGFVDTGRIGIRITDNGIEENDVDTEGLMDIAADVGWETDDS